MGWGWLWMEDGTSEGDAPKLEMPSQASSDLCEGTWRRWQLIPLIPSKAQQGTLGS